MPTTPFFTPAAIHENAQMELLLRVLGERLIEIQGTGLQLERESWNLVRQVLFSGGMGTPTRLHEARRSIPSPRLNYSFHIPYQCFGLFRNASEYLLKSTAEVDLIL
jgi:hypothetical protein